MLFHGRGICSSFENMFSECLLCARNCFRFWGLNGKQNRAVLYPQGANFVARSEVWLNPGSSIDSFVHLRQVT